MKRGSSNTVFWSIMLFILILASVIVFFFLDSFKDEGIDRINLAEEKVMMDINNIKSTDEGIEFVLKVDSQGKKIVRTEFSFENSRFLKENYISNNSYTQKGEYPYSIELKDIRFGEIKRIYILPVARKLPYFSSERIATI